MTGLTNEQVQERIAEGKVNVNENPNTRTYKQNISCMSFNRSVPFRGLACTPSR